MVNYCRYNPAPGHSFIICKTTLPDTRISARILINPLHLLSLGFGAGMAPKMPGTAGTLVGVLFFLLMRYLWWPYYLALAIVMFAAGVWLCGKTADRLGVHDHPAIVWDEIVGYLITMILAPSGWLWILIGFVLFRLFDIWKP